VDKSEWQAKGEGHRQRLRDKFLAQGIEAFTDSEIIELLLTFGTPRADCKEAARAALAQFKTLPAVLDAAPVQLQQIKGIGLKNTFALHFIQGVARRYLRQRIVGKQYVHSSREVADYLIHAMRGLQHEVLTVVFLDAAHGIIDSVVAAEGTVTVNTVYPRELVKAALARNASALIIAHNHPGGTPNPSDDDRRATAAVRNALEAIEVSLLDHIIITASGYFSWRENGLL
jgi:DNA repair protein RadC